jgi:pimeloyl-ACP methyl ester carboxylesterase
LKEDAMADNPKSNKAVVNGAAIHYVTWGRPGAPPVVLLHGLRAYGEWFAPLGEALANNYYVVAPDLRGRNLSDWSKDGDYTIEAYCADLAGLTSQLDLKRYALGGHSLGGAIVGRYAAEHGDQIAALILFDASPEPDPRGRGRIMDEVARTPATFPSWDAARDFLRTLHPKASADHMKTRLRCMLKETGDGTLQWRIDRACTKPNLGPAETAWAALRAIICPTLHLRGAVSDLLTPEIHAKMTAATPDGHKVEIAGAAHMVIEDNPHDVVAASASFLDKYYLPAGATARTA